MHVDGPVSAVKPITTHEPLTRYVTDEEYLTRKSDRVHWRVFKPRPSDKELSIARIDQLSPTEVWQLGDALAGGPSKRTVYGRADFDLSHVRSVTVNGSSRLDAVPDDPPMRHAIIVGWPDDTNARKTAAMLLRAMSVRHIR